MPIGIGKRLQALVMRTLAGSGTIAAKGELVTVSRPSGVAGVAPTTFTLYTLPLPQDITSQRAMMSEGNNNTQRSDAHDFRFPGGSDVRFDDQVFYNGNTYRIASARSMRVQGTTVVLRCTGVREA